MFDQAMTLVLQHEGGYSNDPNDHGGPTNYGLTLDDLSRYRGHQCSINDIRSIGMDEVKAIYKAFYWDPLSLDQVTDQKLQVALFDQGVLSGIRTAAEKVQAIVGVDVDGAIGPITLAALNSWSGIDLTMKFVISMQLRYVSICVQDRSQIVFLEGWIRRTQDLLLL